MARSKNRLTAVMKRHLLFSHWLCYGMQPWTAIDGFKFKSVYTPGLLFDLQKILIPRILDSVERRQDIVIHRSRKQAVRVASWRSDQFFLASLAR